MLWSTLLGPFVRSTQTQISPWFNQLYSQAATLNSCELAILGGRLAATPGLAFLAGYQAALRALLPAAPNGIGALCLSEQGSSKAADLQTRLVDGHLSGQKDFVLGGNAAQWLLVIARNEVTPCTPTQLAATLVDTSTSTVSLRPNPTLKVVPDIPHCSVQFTQTPCEVLIGDGWSDYSKTFRTLEDAHVLAAFCAWLYGQSLLDQWPESLQLQLIAVLAGLQETLHQPHQEAATHLLLAALLAQFESLQSAISTAFSCHSKPEVAQAWQRDKALLTIGQVARERRLENARNTLALI